LSLKSRMVALLLALALVGCAMKPERLAGNVSRRISRLQGYFAEVDAVVFSPRGEQRYRVRQWYRAPDLWRIEVDFGSERQVFLCDGEYVWVYHPGLADYFRLDATAAREVSPPFLLLNYLEELVQAPGYRFEGRQEKEQRAFFVVSYARPATSETIRLWLDNKSLFPQMVEKYRDGVLLNRLTGISFNLNPDFAAGLFEFAAPQDHVASAHYLIRPLSLAEARREWPLPVYVPTYLPQGTGLMAVSHAEEEGRGQLMLTFGGQRSFTLIQRPAGDNRQQRTVGMQEVFIGQTPALYLKNRVGDLHTLWWSNETSAFILTGSLPLAEMMRVAASLTAD